MKIAFIARNDGSDMRQAKICNSLVRLGHEVIYIGWNREPGKQRKNILDPRIQRYVFEWNAGFGEMSLSGWPQFIRFMSMVLGSFRPDVAHVRDEQMASFVLPFKGTLYRYLVLDIFDSLLGRNYTNPALKAGTWAMRHSAQLGADRIIETSEDLQAMLGSRTAKSVIIMNVPHDPGDSVAFDFPDAPNVQICVGGSLSKEREGLETILTAIEMLPEGAVQVQASGWLHDDYAKEVFAKHPAVNYRWLDSPDDFRKIAGKCDAMTYLCANVNGTDYRANVLPNRFFDAMSIGRPLIVSNRLKIAERAQKLGTGFACDPKDPAALAAILGSLLDRRAQLPTEVPRIRKMFTEHYTWNRMEERLGELYDGLARQRAVAPATSS